MFIYLCYKSDKGFRFGKRLASSRSLERENKPKKDTKEGGKPQRMSGAILEELKLMRNDLTSQIKELSDNQKGFFNEIQTKDYQKLKVL